MSAVIDKMSAVGNDSVEVESVGRIELGPELLVRYAIIRDVDYRTDSCHTAITSRARLRARLIVISLLANGVSHQMMQAE